MKGRVLLLHTGGTLGMRPRDPDQVLAPNEIATTVLEHVPELESLAQIEARILFNLDSADMRADHWLQLAQAVHDSAGAFDGIVITHGTDAMTYTASALSYLLRDLPFPVILTGSQRPLADVHTDGRANLVGAVDLAMRPIPEVAIYFNGLLLRGNRAVKRSTFAFGAFESPNHPPLAKVGTGVALGNGFLEPGNDFRVAGSFEAGVAVIWLTPGMDGSVLQALAKSDCVAVLVVAPGVGNIPVEETTVADGIRALVAAGKIVAVGSQSRRGYADLNRYAGGRLAQEIGAVDIADMTLEAAAVKLMYLAGTAPTQAKELLRVPIAGEVTGSA